jgi:hypothetical protein
MYKKQGLPLISGKNQKILFVVIRVFFCGYSWQFVVAKNLPVCVKRCRALLLQHAIAFRSLLQVPKGQKEDGIATLEMFPFLIYFNYPLPYPSSPPTSKRTLPTRGKEL